MFTAEYPEIKLATSDIIFAGIFALKLTSFGILRVFLANRAESVALAVKTPPKASKLTAVRTW